MNTPDSVSELVRRAQQGDATAFGVLVKRYHPRILALCMHLTGGAHDAEDTAQEVFFAAFRSIHKFEGRSHFFTWLYRMAVNRSFNTRRSRKRRRETDDPRLERAIAVDAKGNPARAAALRETYKRLLFALDQLPTKMRTSVVLVTLQGLNHEEAAVVQACAPGTIAWRIHEARRRLQRSMERSSAKPRSKRQQNLSADLLSLLNDCGLPVPA